MKGMIEVEGQRREYSANLKLGPGGIREIEFIAQSLQLVRGGTVTELRDRQLQRVLPKLVRHQCLPAEVADELMTAYRFLRRAENFLQAIEDRQTHDLPENELDRTRLAFAMDAPDWETFLASCTAQRACGVQHCAAERTLRRCATPTGSSWNSSISVRPGPRNSEAPALQLDSGQQRHPPKC